jgi:hypothetical protein
MFASSPLKRDAARPDSGQSILKVEARRTLACVRQLA